MKKVYSYTCIIILVLYYQFSLANEFEDATNLACNGKTIDGIACAKAINAEYKAASEMSETQERNLQNQIVLKQTLSHQQIELQMLREEQFRNLLLLQELQK